MPSIAKPTVTHPKLAPNSLGLTVRNYEGAMSTLCAGCGHDSITAALIRALWEMEIPPRMIGKLSGIGCSSKTTAYFAGGAHGFNSAHGRMPSLATGAAAANRDMLYIGISGDGDSLSIGLGQLAHAIRRNVRMLYIIENNGVYGLTKGQFSASADLGSKSKRGEPNQFEPIDPILLALSLGATFVARGFSGDKEQLIPILKGGIAHRGFALVDVISPCVSFNDHEGSTKSYMYTRLHDLKAIDADFTPPEQPILASIPEGGRTIAMHNGALVRFLKTPDGYDPTNRESVVRFVEKYRDSGEIVTGLLYVDDSPGDMHAINQTAAEPLNAVPYEKLCPGSAALDKLQERFR